MPDQHPLTVVQLLPALDGGGVETDVAGLSAALVRAGYRSIVVSGGGRMVEKIEADGGEHITLPVGKKSLKSLLLLRQLRLLLRERKADIVHAHSRVPAWLGFLAWRGMDQTDRPHFVTTVHGLNSPGFFSGVMLRGEKVIAVSNTVQTYLAKHYPQAELSKVAVIPRGVDPVDFPYGYKPGAQWAASWQAQFPQLRGKFVVTLAGRLTRLKGHLEAIEALAQLRQKSVDAHLLLVGGEDPRRAAYAAQLRQAVVEKQLAEQVTFTGHRSDIRDILASSDAVLSCSTKPETFGLSVLESVRLGVPVAGYDHGGVGEVLAEVYPEGRVPFAATPEERAALLAEKLAALAYGKITRPGQGAQFPLSETHRQTLDLYGKLAQQLPNA